MFVHVYFEWCAVKSGGVPFFARFMHTDLIVDDCETKTYDFFSACIFDVPKHSPIGKEGAVVVVGKEHVLLEFSDLLVEDELWWWWWWWRWCWRLILC